MTIEAYYDYSMDLKMKKVMRYCLTYTHGKMPTQITIANDLKLNQSHVCEIFKQMVKRKYVKKLGRVKKNGFCEGYRFYPEKIFTQDELVELGIGESE